jgi:hypothetical protein
VSEIVELASDATEADVELKVIMPLLTNQNFLAIPSTSIKGKTYLAPTVLDKGAGKTGGYYPDFSVWELALPVLIVEAKGPEVSVDVGYREASLYARHLNQDYKSGVNPCKFILACNGSDLAYGTWDSNASKMVKVADLRIGSNDLEALTRFCHHRLLVAHATRCLSAIRLARSTEPYTLAGGQAVINSKKPFNTFAAELAPLLRRYFTSTTQNSDPEIYEKAYVGSDDVTEYDRILESLLKERIASRRSLSQELHPTRSKEPKLAAAIGKFKADRSSQGELQLITGGVGTGKSLFARRYKELLQPNEQRQWTHWAFIDFNTAPDPLSSAENWLCQQFVDSFHRENPSFDPYANENLTRIFSQDLQRRRGIYDEIKKKVSAPEAEKARIDDLQRWQSDLQRLALGICRHFAAERREVVVVVMDNVDRLDLEGQLAAFRLSLWFLDQSKAFIILQMRDETYERFKDKPPLDTFRSGVVFHITPPRFLDVVKRRLELSLEYLSENTPETLEYSLSSGIRITYPNSMLGQFLKSIYLELFDRKHNVSRILQGLAGRDVRRALDMFVSILNSGHLQEEAITSTARGAGGIAIPEYRVLRILMRTEYRFFNDNSGFVANIFHFDDAWHQPNNFILPEILFWLCDNRKQRGEIGLEGFFTIDRIADDLQRRGFVRADILASCSWLLRKQLIEADHMNQSKVEFHDSVKVTASGFIHIRILSERLEYLYGILTVTPISEKAAAQEISDYLRRENQFGHLGGFQQLRCAEIFLKYLKEEHARLKSAYHEFGSDRSGASFVIKQTESAIAYFKNPTLRPAERNLLDE